MGERIKDRSSLDKNQGGEASGGVVDLASELTMESLQTVIWAEGSNQGGERKIANILASCLYLP